jgi:hypothetical protein
LFHVLGLQFLNFETSGMMHVQLITFSLFLTGHLKSDLTVPSRPSTNVQKLFLWSNVYFAAFSRLY